MVDYVVLVTIRHDGKCFETNLCEILVRFVSSSFMFVSCYFVLIHFESGQGDCTCYFKFGSCSVLSSFAWVLVCNIVTYYS